MDTARRPGQLFVPRRGFSGLFEALAAGLYRGTMLPLISASDLVLRLQADLEAVRREQPRARPILAFDADGTLWSGDVGEEVFARVLEHRKLKPAVAEPLRAVARSFGLDEFNDPYEQARAIYRAHDQGRFPERDLYMVMAWAFAGYRPDEMIAFAEALIEERGGAARHHAELRPVLEWAQVERVEVWVVSASPQMVVEQGVARLSIPRRNVLAMRPRVTDGYLTAVIEEPATYAEGKAEALRRHVEDAVVLGAFGDNSFDVRMFHMARQPVAVRPKRALLDHPELPSTTVQLVEALTSCRARRGGCG